MALMDKISSLKQINIDDLYNDFLGLEQKQQIFVGVGIALVLLLILSLPISCVSSKINEKEEGYLKYMKMASDFYGVQAEYSKLQTSFDRIKKSSSKLGSDPLKRVIYSIADEVGIQQQKVAPKTISPVTFELFTELGKEVTIKNIRFDQTINLLNLLVTYKDVPIKIKKLAIKVDPKNKQMMRTVSMTITTIKPNK